MAECSEPIPTLCIEWNSGRPIPNTPCRSNNFLLLGAKYHFRFECSSPLFGNNTQYKILLIRETDTRPPAKIFYGETEKLFCISVFVDDRKLNGFRLIPASPSVALTAVYPEKETPIWKCTADDLPSTIFRECGEWRVICVFHGVTSSDFQSEEEAVHLSSKSEVNGPTTSSEKCVQASNSSTTSADKGVQTSIPSVPHLEQLSGDYSDLLENKIFPDVTLSCAGQTRSVHRSILAARSEVFSAMFRNRMLESETSCIDINDLEDSVLDKLLKYVYSGKIPDFCEDTAAGLYEASDKYAVSTLKKTCSDWMIGNMTEANCIIFLNLADVHSDEEFKDTVVAFIHDHPTIFESDMWSVFSEKNFKLAIEVMKGYIASTTKK